MSLLTKLTNRFKPKEKRSYTDYMRSVAEIANSIFTFSGERVDSKTALAINAVYVSAKILGETTASYTFQTIEKKGELRTPVDTAVSKIFGTMANQKYGITAFNYWETVLLHKVTSGNHYSIIERENGKVTGVLPVRPTNVDVFLDKKLGIYYHIKEPDLGIDKVYLSEDILHFKGMSWLGSVGVNPTKEQKELLGLAQKISKYAGKVYGEKPNGYISTDEILNPDDVKDMAKSWADQKEGDNLGKTPILMGGMKFNQVSLSLAEVEYIKSRGITSQDIYAMNRIPPTLAQDYERATFANAEQQDLILSKYTMLPHIRNFEQEIQSKLLPDNIQAKFNMNSIMRADFETRSKGFATMLEHGALSPNEWRAKEDMNPVDHGDVRYVPLNFKIADGKENV